MGVRVVVIGTGFGRRVAAPAYEAVPGCEVAAIVTARDAGAVAAACARTDIDLVSVHSPPFLHREHVHRALDGGHAVLCDKPFGLDAGDATAMVEHVQAADRRHAVNFEFRFDPGRRRLRDLLAGGAIGPVREVIWTHLSTGSLRPLRPHGWLFDATLGGGWVGAWGSHAVDVLRWLVGDVVAVDGTRRLDIPERPDPGGAVTRSTAEDGLEAQLVLETGTRVTLVSSFASQATVPPRLTLVGDHGSLESTADRRIVHRDPDGRPVEHAGAGERTDEVIDRHDAGMLGLARAMCDAARGEPRDPDLATFADGAAVAHVLDALRALPLRSSD